MIVTTNDYLKAWDRVLSDDDPGQIIVDRVIDRGRLGRLDARRSGHCTCTLTRRYGNGEIATTT